MGETTQGTGRDDVLTLDKLDALLAQFGRPLIPRAIVGHPVWAQRARVVKITGREHELWMLHADHVKALREVSVPASGPPPLTGMELEPYAPERHDDLVRRVVLEALPPLPPFAPLDIPSALTSLAPVSDGGDDKC